MSGVKLRLTCLTWPDDNPIDHLVEVKINNDETVMSLKDMIKLKYAPKLDKVAASDLVLWKCSIPADNSLQETLKSIHFHAANPRLHRLPAASLLSKHLEAGLSPEIIQILVEVPGQVSELAENLRFLNIVQNFGKMPSAAAKSNEYVKFQEKQEFAIHDGLYSKPKSNTIPMTTVAPPVHIFHPIFGQFIGDANDLDLDLPREFLIQVQEFMAFASLLKTSEPASNPEWRQLLSKLLDIGLHETQNADGTRSDGISTIDITTLDESAPLFVCEYKGILGEGGCDPSIQAGCSMKWAWIQRDRSAMRDKCCCPTFMIAGGGPWMCILGAVFTDKVIVQRLTDMMWIGLSSTSEEARIHRFARLMMALRQCLPKLHDYYEKISTAKIPPFNEGSPHPRFYPYPTSFLENGKLTYFDYVKMLEDHPTCVTYLAKIRKDVKSSDDVNELVVKFVDRYGHEVHQFLADNNHSPKIRYYGPLEGDRSLGHNSAAPPTTASPSDILCCSPMKMVVMDYVKPYPRPADAHAQLEKILSNLHTAGYVFGDLREPNILFDRNGKVQLIDLNWAGRYNTEQQDTDLPPDLMERIQEATGRIQSLVPAEFVNYPLNLSPNIKWADGVGALLPIRPQHDWDMLQMLQWHSM